MTPEAIVIDVPESLDMEPPKELIKGSGIYMIESEIPHKKNGHVVVVDEHTIIDSGGFGEVDRIESSLDALGFSLELIKRVLITDIHADHLGGAKEIQSRSGAEIIVPKGYRKLLLDGENLETLTCQNLYPHMKRMLPSEWMPEEFTEVEYGVPIKSNGTRITSHQLRGHGPYTTGYMIEICGVRLFILGDAFNGGFNKETIFSSKSHWITTVDHIRKTDFDCCTDGHSPKEVQPFTKYVFERAAERFLENLEKGEPVNYFIDLALYWN